MRNRVDLGILLLLAVAGGCAYVEDQSVAGNQRSEQGGPARPPVAEGVLRPLSANVALFDREDDQGGELGALDQEVVTLRNGSKLSARRFVAADHLEITFAPDGDDLGGERAIRLEMPEGSEDELEVTTDKCYDFRPTYDNFGCIIVLKAARRLPVGVYRIVMAYAADPERALTFTVTD